MRAAVATENTEAPWSKLGLDEGERRRLEKWVETGRVREGWSGAALGVLVLDAITQQMQEPTDADVMASADLAREAERIRVVLEHGVEEARLHAMHGVVEEIQTARARLTSVCSRLAGSMPGASDDADHAAVGQPVLPWWQQFTTSHLIGAATAVVLATGGALLSASMVERAPAAVELPDLDDLFELTEVQTIGSMLRAKVMDWDDHAISDRESTAEELCVRLYDHEIDRIELLKPNGAMAYRCDVSIEDWL